jgi:hypothetical protein
VGVTLTGERCHVCPRLPACCRTGGEPGSFVFPDPCSGRLNIARVRPRRGYWAIPQEKSSLTGCTSILQDGVLRQDGSPELRFDVTAA